MRRSYSLDLRQRLIDRVAGGQSRRGAAEDLAVSASFAVKLAARHEKTGSLDPAPQGRPPGTGKLNGVNPHAWLTDTLTKLVNRWPASRIDELMPWAYANAEAA